MKKINGIIMQYFEWNWTHFDAIDYDDNSKQNAIFKIVNYNKMTKKCSKKY